jgi:hypothetical protein
MWFYFTSQTDFIKQVWIVTFLEMMAIFRHDRTVVVIIFNLIISCRFFFSQNPKIWYEWLREIYIYIMLYNTITSTYRTKYIQILMMAIFRHGRTVVVLTTGIWVWHYRCRVGLTEWVYISCNIIKCRYKIN